MSYKILEFKESLSTTGFLDYPINEMDDAYYNEHGKPPSGKYAKMLRRATPIADEIWKQSLTVKSKLHDVQFLIDNPITNRALECLVEQYASLDIELQELNKCLKKTKQEQPLQEYYEQYEDVYSVDVFDMLSNDMEKLLPIGVAENTILQTQYDLIPPLDVSLDELKAYYKPALKKAKDAKKKMLQKQKEAA